MKSCLQDFDSDKQWKPFLPQKAKRIAKKYLCLGVVLLAISLFFKGWAYFLLWLDLSVFLMSLAYFFYGPRIFKKTEGLGDEAGKRAIVSRIVLAPYEITVRLLRKFVYEIPPAVKLTDGLWLGGFPKTLPVPHCGLLDLASEYPKNNLAYNAPYASVPMIDLLPPAIAELRKALIAYYELKKRGPVLVHCALGMTRSATTVCFILRSEGIFPSLVESLAYVKNIRPKVTITNELMIQYEELIRSGLIDITSLKKV